MPVTLQRPAPSLDVDVRHSIDLVVAQWLRDPHTTFAARAMLRATGISEAEIAERRRARSKDPELARVLRFAVTAIITAGRPEERDIRRLGALGHPALVTAILEAAASSHRRVTLASVLSRGATPPIIDMNVGDY